MIREKSCGAVIFYRDSKILYLVEQMIQGHYALCKGHVPYVGKAATFKATEAKGKANRVQPEEVSALLWLEYNQAMRFLTYDSDKKILANARKHIK